MTKLRIVAELTVDEQQEWGDDPAEFEWYKNDFLTGNEALTLYSEEIEDTVGRVSIIEVIDPEV